MSQDIALKKILVVDDEPDITSSIKNGLEKKGFKVDVYNEPLKALADFSPITTTCC